MPTQNHRLLTIQVIQQVLAGDSLTALLERHANRKDIGLIQAWSYGVIRWYILLDSITQQLIQKPIKPKDQDIQILILLGLYQLYEQHDPEYAVVSETVNTTEVLGKAWAKKLVNAVLRRFTRERESLLQQVCRDPAVCHALPDWICSTIKADWPAYAESILQEINKKAPMVLRANLQKNSRDEYLQHLEHTSLAASRVDGSKTAIQLEAPCDVTVLPGFAQGWASVQDAAAQFAAPSLDPKPGERVLDACAAPGGKFMHLLEYEPELALAAAVEKDRSRVEKIYQNLQRGGYQAGESIKIISADAKDIAAWWDGLQFDKILLDAPCSSSGVIRRHPDIKLLRREKDISALATLQRALLYKLWEIVKPGGILLYATCSIFKVENEQQIADFMLNNDDAETVTLNLPLAVREEYGYQIMPGTKGMDGFYYAGLQKISS